MGIISAIFPSYLWVRLCQIGIALAAGMFMLNAGLPGQPPIPPLLDDPPAERLGTQQIALWFGGATALPELRLLGMITGADQGAALLSINQKAVQAYRQGQELAPGVVLHAVQRQHITVTVDGVPQTITTERSAPAVSDGIQRAAHP